MRSNSCSQPTSLWSTIFEILSLIIAARGVTPAVAMKTLSELFALVVIAVITTVVVVSCCNFPFITDTITYVELGHVPHHKTSERTYVPWKSETDFNNALLKIHKRAKICICVLKSPGHPYKHELSNDCPSTYKCPSEPTPTPSIRTVNVIKSKTANNTLAAESVTNDPNVTWRIQASPQDLNEVMNTLATPTPAP
jgi:hypothetical protein